MIYLSAETIDVTPRAGGEGRSLTAAKVEQVYTPLKTTIFLVQDGAQEPLCLICSHFMTHYYRFSNTFRAAVAERLKIDMSRVLSFSSHNHCAVKLVEKQYSFGRQERDVYLPINELSEDGQSLLNATCAAAETLGDRLEPVQVRWAVGHERRISHHRKGYRADGSTYLIREEDRLALGDDFNGDIDDDAPVVGFFGADGKPRAFLAGFTAHPVTAFDPEHPVVFGEYAQVACDVLSEAQGGVPVGFLQGCAGDVNSKGLLADKPIDESVADGQRYGRWLGETWLQALASATPCASDAVTVSERTVTLPFAGLPPRELLQGQLADIETFLARCDASDEPGTRVCQGLNFPKNMSPTYRSKLVEPLKRWAEWAMSLHDTDPGQVPTGADFQVAAARIGDIGIVGLTCEPFQAIGRQIKQGSPFALTIPCGYMHDTSLAYVPSSGNNGDNEYMSAFYRYTTTLLPYDQPAGDRLAEAGVQQLQQLKGS